MKKATRLLSIFGVAALLLLALAGCTKTGGEAAHYVIYSDNSFAPFEFLDTATGEFTGVDMDLLAAIAEDQGFTYDMKNEGFDAAMGAVQSGNADGMIAGMTINEKRQAIFDFSEGYFEDGQIMVVAKDSDIQTLEDIRGKTVAAKIGTMGTEYAESIKDEYNLTLVNFEDSPTMYAAVMQGNCDVCFEDRSVVEWAIKSGELSLQTVGEVIDPSFYGFAVLKGENADLIQAFNKGLENIKESGTYDEILAKYGY